MSVYGFASRHRRALVLIVAGLAVAGLFSVSRLPSGIYPDLLFPRILVLAHSGSLPARSMVVAVARPLEQAAMEVPGLRRVRSRTFRGESELSVLFAPKTDMGEALQQLQNRIAGARGSLPPGTEVDVEPLTLAAFPMFSLNLTGGLSVADLRDQAFYVLRPALSRVPGVGRVEVAASDAREIEVVADPRRLLTAGATTGDVARALAARGRLDPIGLVHTAGEQRPVLVSGEFESLDDLGSTPVSARGASITRVRDVAEVFPGAPDRTLLVTGDGRAAAVVSVAQQPGADILEVRRGIGTALREVAASLPSGLRITKVYDLAEFVASAVANVRDAVLIGALLAVLVLIAFLRDWRMTLAAAITLPLTVVCTFPFLYLFGESINLMSMGGLAVAIGLVIDDAVVVVENIHRRLRLGDGGVREAVAELTAPVIGSTLTTVVVLAPLGLLSGIAGQFFRSLSVTLSIAVLLSLGLALTLIPVLAEGLYSRRPPRQSGPEGRDRLSRSYERGLRRFLGRPRLAVAAVILLAVLGGALLVGGSTGFLPAMDEGGFVIDYLAPPGTALAETDARVRAIEKAVAATPEAAAFSRRTGSELGLFATVPNKGDVLVRLKPRDRRARSAAQVIDDLRGRLEHSAPGLEIEFLQLLQDMLGDLEGTASPIEIKVFGDAPSALQTVAEQVAKELEVVPGVVDVVAPQQGAPELVWHVDADAAARLGSSVEEIAAQAASALSGEVATAMREDDRVVPIRVRLPDADRFDPRTLSQLPLRGSDGKLVQLASLARPVVARSEDEIVRENQRRMALITAHLADGRDLGGAVAAIGRRLRRLALPVGFTLEIGGQYEAQRRAFRELLLVFALAAALVLLVMVAQFRAATPALVILAAAPLSLGGALLLLRLTGTELNVSSGMGLILLVGLAVKNGIVLLDYAHRLRDQGLSAEESLARAAGVRLRPILMTTLCTLFGLLPLALGLGAGAELQRPLALAVIGGLGLSTLVTLFIVPVLYAPFLARRAAPFPAPEV